MGRRQDIEELAENTGSCSRSGNEKTKLFVQEKNIRIPDGSERNVKNNVQKRDFYDLLVHTLQNTVPRRKILHDIYARDADGGRDGLARRCMGINYGGNIFITAAHGDHWHVVHDCNYSSSTCRCARINYFKDNFTRFGRRLVHSSEFTVRHWYNLAAYFEKGGRQLDIVYIAGRTWLQYNKTGRNTLQGCSNFGQTELVEGSNDEKSISDFIACGSNTNEGERIGESGTSVTKKTRTEKRCKGARIEEFIQKLPAAPLSNIFSTRYWSQGPWRYESQNSPLMQTVMKNIGLQYCDKTIEDMYKIFRSCEANKLIFNAPMGDISTYYYGLKKSVYIMEELLKFQFRDNRFLIEQFLQDVYNICNKVKLKKNTLFVLSQANAGKNYFFDAVVHYFLNFGLLGNFNKYNGFPMMECVNRRIILWNEPVVEPSAFETLKTIFGGDTANAKVKFSGDAIIGRTPVIVLSNNDVFPKDSAFRTRMIKYEWQPCPHLKLAKKKPWPLAFYYLLKKYGILDKAITQTESDDE
uniref:Nonstructural protein NS1 n=1 Tax=Phylloscopus inornatus ambidensovirus TaxID=2794452 RepID=A0A8E7G2K7_9VIRU|nr:MAG: putative nonstructural protein NS1 [Phylloscopus inornatus ambidensovirus]